MRHASFLIAAAAATAIGGLLITACDDNTKQPTTPATSTAGAPATSTTASSNSTAGGVAASDQTITTTTIRNHQVGDQDISAIGTMVSIPTANGVVLHSGFIHAEGDHQKILALVHHVDGVARIDDYLVVL